MHTYMYARVRAHTHTHIYNHPHISLKNISYRGLRTYHVF